MITKYLILSKLFIGTFNWSVLELFYNWVILNIGIHSLQIQTMQTEPLWNREYLLISGFNMLNNHSHVYHSSLIPFVAKLDYDLRTSWPSSQITYFPIFQSPTYIFNLFIRISIRSRNKWISNLFHSILRRYEWYLCPSYDNQPQFSSLARRPVGIFWICHTMMNCASIISIFAWDWDLGSRYNNVQCLHYNRKR